MRATIEIPDDLYRQIAAKTAAEGRPLHELALELFRDYLGVPAQRLAPGEPVLPAASGAAASQRIPPPWFGVLKEKARKVRDHDMNSIRQSIARGIVEERDL